MKEKKDKIQALTSLVNNGELGEALTYAVMNRFPKAWVERCHNLLTEKNAPIYAAASVVIPECDDVVAQDRMRIIEEMRREREDKKRMNKKEARQMASSFIRTGKYAKAKELETRFGESVITKNYRRETSKYMLWCKRQRLGIIGEYRNLVIVDFDKAQAFKRSHEIQESEIKPTFGKG